jgi:hypothetical protein
MQNPQTNPHQPKVFVCRPNVFIGNLIVKPKRATITCFGKIMIAVLTCMGSKAPLGIEDYGFLVVVSNVSLHQDAYGLFTTE